LSLSNSLGDLNPTIISAQVQLASQQELPWMQLIDWRGYNQPGLTHQVAQAAALTMSAIVYTDANTPADASTGFDMTNRQITLSTKALDVNVYLEAIESAAADPQTFIVDSIRKAYVKKVATDIMALYTEGNNSGANQVGTAGTPVSYLDHFLPAFEAIANGATDPPYTWVLATTQISEVGSETQFSEWQKLGQAMLDANISAPAGFLGIAPWGVNVYWSNHYTASSGNHGMMFSKGAFLMLEKMPFTVSIDSSEQLVRDRVIRIGGTTIYGVSGQRDSSTANLGVVDIVS